MIGNPENPPVLEAHFRLKIAGAEIELTRPVEYRYVDHIYGEQTPPAGDCAAGGRRFGGAGAGFRDPRRRARLKSR